ncbi:MAG TPA: hypothetical protein QKA08_04075 [Candidatus Megaira endosymbiont of Nemacystus decipiens]|nr:hypothetical protein [Candidatus Megaera endosymbiont of Nemacystus decipiens]
MINSLDNTKNSFISLPDNEDKIPELIEKLKDLLIETDVSDLTNLKSFLIQQQHLLEKINLDQMRINLSNNVDVYTIIAREICSPSNTEKYPDLDDCFNLAKDAIDELGGDHYSLLEEHYQ